MTQYPHQIPTPIWAQVMCDEDGMLLFWTFPVNQYLIGTANLSPSGRAEC